MDNLFYYDLIYYIKMLYNVILPNDEEANKRIENRLKDEKRIVNNHLIYVPSTFYILYLKLEYLISLDNNTLNYLNIDYISKIKVLK